MIRRPLTRSPARCLTRSPARAFTLIEMLTTVAVLIIVLGLMVSLARYVRDRSANELTQSLLLRLDDLAREYEQRTGHPPEDIPPILSAADVVGNEPAVQAAARLNNARFVEVMKGEFARSGLLKQERGDLPISLYNGRILADAWGNPIVFMPDQHPAIGMAPMRASPSGIGTVGGGGAGNGGGAPTTSASTRPRDRASSAGSSSAESAAGSAGAGSAGAGSSAGSSSFFLFSAGPDGRYLTREDNVYSYEQAGRK